ncbi:NAD(P)/FAD-dependent oxidoreductase [Pedobacter sp.]|uniref:NAD(P)/FAD-dependent oxidoreductase n=1 Tax=Pedobacter sp. TaxID=1411316 RepID=UPI003D7F71FB
MCTLPVCSVHILLAMLLQNNVIIAGGGLAGLIAAIHLSKAGVKVTLFEKHPFPQHKVCGEYISNEVLPYLQSLGADPSVLHPNSIYKFQFSTSSGKSMEAKLPLGGFGLSRYAFDNFLMKKAISEGCEIIQDTVLTIDFIDHEFLVTTGANGILKAPLVLGAYGKRTALDHQLQRHFMNQASPWLAVKAHYTGEFDEHLVALHHFKGGYCGVSKVENDLINICYLCDYATFKKYRNLNEFQQQVLYQNEHLQTLFESSKIVFEQPLTIAQLNFQKKEVVKNHVLMIGDTAGLIHPLCGNGMSMAIHSAKLSAEQVLLFLKGNTRASMESQYKQLWQFHFKQRLQMGHILSGLLRKEKLATIMTSTLANFPFILPQLIKKTHGHYF